MNAANHETAKEAKRAEKAEFQRDKLRELVDRALPLIKDRREADVELNDCVRGSECCWCEEAEVWLRDAALAGAALAATSGLDSPKRA